MAVDEALLDEQLQGPANRGPTLRLYGWSPPALSLGKSQPARGSHDASYLHRERIGLVRRPTGGRAVLHEAERTYAVVGALEDPAFRGGVQQTYRAVSEAVCAALRAMGVDARHGAEQPWDGEEGPVCFQRARPHEITVGGAKIVGSAQLRRRGAFLQHGSILLAADAQRLGRAIGTLVRSSSLTDLTRELGREPDPEALDRALLAAFENRFQRPLEPGPLEAREQQRAAELYSWKYLSQTWTHCGRIGSRERRHGRVAAR